MVIDGSSTFAVMKRRLRLPRWWGCLPLIRGGGSASPLSRGGGGAPTSAQKEEEKNGQAPSCQGVSSYLFWFVSEKLVYMVMC